MSNDEFNIVLDRIHSESKSTLDNQLDLLSDMDTKAQKSIRLNLVFLGLIASIVSYLARTGNSNPLGAAANSLTGLGTFFLAISTFFGILVYTEDVYVLGLSKKDILKALVADYNSDKFMVVLNKYHGDSIVHNGNQIEKNGQYLKLTFMFQLASLASFIGGIVLIEYTNLSKIIISLTLAFVVIQAAILWEKDSKSKDPVNLDGLENE